MAALLVPGSQLTIRGVGLNPTRSALLDFLIGMGAQIRVPDLESRNGELVGDILVEHSALRGGTIEGGLTAALIDEIPVLAVLGAATEEGLTVQGRRRTAHQGDGPHPHRGRTICAAWAWRRKSCPTGMVIPGRQKFRAAAVRLIRRSSHRHGVRGGGAAGDGESVINERRCGIGVVPGVLGHATSALRAAR